MPHTRLLILFFTPSMMPLRRHYAAKASGKREDITPLRKAMRLRYAAMMMVMARAYDDMAR